MKVRASRIYLDHAAATAVDPRVFAAMEPYFSGMYANPSSVYQFAQQARLAADKARERTAKILECAPREIIFTLSSATTALIVS